MALASPYDYEQQQNLMYSPMTPVNIYMPGEFGWKVINRPTPQHINKFKSIHHTPQSKQSKQSKHSTHQRTHHHHQDTATPIDHQRIQHADTIIISTHQYNTTSMIT
jgi:hypothetical protein